MNDGLMTTQQAAEHLGFTPRFLEARRLRGGGPRFVRISSRAIRYRSEDLEQWVREHLASNTSEEVNGH